MSARFSLQRRTFLQALALGLSTPVAYKFAKYALAAPADRPRRFFSFYLPHGMPVEHFDPTGDTGALNLSALPGVGILAPLVPYQSLINLYRGIEYIGYNNHPAISGVMTNGAGASVDHVIANALGTKSYNIGAVPWRVNDFGPDSQLYNDGSDWVRPELNPVKAAADLLAGIGGDDPGGDEQGASDKDFRNAALDLSAAEIDSLRKKVKGLSREESKLTTHLEALQQLKESTDGGDNQTGQGCSSKPSMPALDKVKMASSDGQNSSYFLDEANFPDIYEAQLEVAAYSMLCGGARVMGFQTMFVNAMINFGFMGIAKDHHDPLSHSIDAAGRAEFAKVQQWLLERFVSKFLKVLEQPDPEDPAHSFLENSLIYFASEISDGNAHNCNKEEIWVDSKQHYSYLPLLTIGGAGGALKTGQKLNFENRSHADLLMTLCKAMGAPVNSFGPNSGSTISEVEA